MARAKFTYDESGATFFYFLLSFLALIIIPSTYYLWPSDDQDEVKSNQKQCRCQGCTNKKQHLRTHDKWKKTKRRIIRILLILGWVAFTATAYKCANIQHDNVNWDPFEIMGVSHDATEAEIRKAYRKLSLIYHPDKETGDADKFHQMLRAYKALTDDEARKNWQTYGNPDGPGATSFGIALPSWIVERENSFVVLGIYALIFMVALPVSVGVWWYRSVKFGCDKVLLNTSELYYYFIHKTPHMVLKRVLMILAASLEFAKSHNAEIIERPTDNQEVPHLIRELPKLGEKNKERPLCFSYSIKSRAIIHAHISRMKLPMQTLELDRCLIIRKCPYLLQEFVQCVAQLITLALSGRISKIPSLVTLENAMKLGPMIIQALWEFESPLLQLPHFTNDTLRHFASKKKKIKSIEQLARMKEADRRPLLKNYSDEQYNDIRLVMSQMPYVDVATKIEVLDDEDPGIITAGSIVTVTVNLTRKSMGDLFDTGESKTSDMNAFGDCNSSSQDQENQSDSNAKAKQQPESNRRVWEKKEKKKNRKFGGGSKGKGSKKSNKLKNKQNDLVKGAEDQKLLKDYEIVSKKVSESSQEEVDDKESIETGSIASEKDLDIPNDKPLVKQDVEKEEAVNNDTSNPSDDEEEWDRFQERVIKKQKVFESKSKKSHSVHCPYFPDDKQEYWWVYLVDRKRHALVTAPLLVTSLVEKEEFELKFTAPHRPGSYTYTIVVRSDSYVDCIIQRLTKVSYEISCYEKNITYYKALADFYSHFSSIPRLK